MVCFLNAEVISMIFKVNPLSLKSPVHFSKEMNYSSLLS